MAYYAHSVTERPEADWERLADHLAEVEAGAASRGQGFGAAALAALAGRLHDVGKYSPDFQARLRGLSGRVDHSTAGAVWAFERLPPVWGRLLAHVVAGHHAGLKDDLLGPEGRIETGRGLLASIEGLARADGFAPPRDGCAPAGLKPAKDEERGEQGFQLAFLTRMIFSCLIDADRSAAARFDAHARGATMPQAAQPSVASLQAALHASMSRRRNAPGELNALRDEVLQAAIARAAEPPGVFTLTVPTGGGKTLTSLAFALAHALAHDLDRVIVVIPYTSIIEQTAQVYRDALDPFGDAVLEHHSAFERTDETDARHERIGPDRLRLSMERWRHPIVVTTAVQFFESLFSARPSRCRKLHSLARSVIVVDEAQTMPLPLLRPCIAALKELARNYGASVVLCTATQPALAAPSSDQRGFAGGFKAPREIAPDVPRLFAALRRVSVRDIGVKDDAALAELIGSGSQALCIVNQRAHARALFAAVAHLPGARHLSTCMHSVHRARVLAGIRADLAAGLPCRVISTSLIEAGVDLDFPRVLRASAGLDQIAQAAGRCNREFRRRPEQSEVLVFASASHGVVRSLVAQAESGAEMLRLYADDPFGPPAMRAYFDMLYWRRGHDELDRAGVLTTCAEHRGDLNFPFESIAAAMRFIDDAMLPVIVAREESLAGTVEALLGELRFATSVGGLASRLQRYTVGVPRRVRAAMIADRVAEVVRPEAFGDQFVVLRSLDLYTAQTGLDWTDLSFVETESLILT